MTGGLSDLCIKRPVMTVLVMLSILLAGLIGYRLMPVADLPNVDFPTIHGQRLPARRQPRHHGLDGGDHPREGVLVDCRHRLDELGQFHRPGPGDRAVFPGSQYRCGRPGHPVRHRPYPAAPARRHAVAAVLPQDQPGRHPDHVHHPDQPVGVDVGPRPVRPDHERADLDAQRRGPGADPRHQEICGAGAARPGGAHGLQPRFRAGGRGHRRPERQHPDGPADRTAPLRDPEGRRPDLDGRRVRRDHRRHARRQTGAPVPGGHGHRRGGKRGGRGLDVQRQRALLCNLPGRPEAARQQHPGGRGTGEIAVPGLPGHACRRRCG